MFTIGQGDPDPLLISAYFLFDLENYAITVKTVNSNTPKVCTVTGGNSGNDDGTGFIDGADYDGILITCIENGYALGGSINGLIFEGENSITLQNNGMDDYFSSANGVFQFQSLVADSDNYAVTVAVQPTFPNQNCVVTGGNSGNNDGTGTINAAADNSLVVNCTAVPYTLGGTVTGLSAGESVELQNDSADNLIVTSNGVFNFPTTLHGTQSYAVTVLNQPSSTKTCVATGGSGTQNNGSGLMQNSNETSIVITCVQLYSIGGTLNGLPNGVSVILQNNGGDDLELFANGSFTFATTYPDFEPYAVTVLTQPFAGVNTCFVTGGEEGDGSGDVLGENVINVVVSCGTDKYSIGGVLSGLPTGKSITLQNNSGDDLQLTANGMFTFSTKLVDLSAYAVTVLIGPNPLAQTCFVTGGSNVTDGTGVIAGQDVTSIVVSCSENQFTISGTLTGLAQGMSLMLQNNGGDDLTLNANGGFTFATALNNNQPYAVTILNQPVPGAIDCFVTGGSALNNGTGVIAGANITNIEVNCGLRDYQLGGNVTGLEPNHTLTLSNNMIDEVIISNNGAFVFNAMYADLSSFSVTVTQQPTQFSNSESCTISGGNSGNDDGTGTIQGQNYLGIIVTCQTRPLVSVDVYTAFEDITFSANDANGTVTGLNDNGVFVNDVSSLPLSVVNPGNSNALGIGGSITMNADGTFSYVPPSNLFGTATYVYLVTNGVVTLTSSLTIEVLPVNDKPSFTLDGDIHEALVIPEGFVEYFQFVDALNVDFGQPNESSQFIVLISVSIIDDVNAIISSANINNLGKLDIIYTGNIGTAKLGVTLQDSGGTTNGGEDTSAVVEFNVTHENPIYSNGFE